MIKKIFVFLLIFCFGYADSFITAGYRGSFSYSLIRDAILNSSLALIESEGDIENLRNVFKKDTVSLGVVQKDILQDLIAGDMKAKEEIVILSPLYKAPILIVTSKKSSITSLKDLSNVRVITDLKGSGSYYTFLKLQELYMITPEVYNMKIDEGLRYLQKGKAEALFFIGDISKIEPFLGSFKLIPVLLPSYKTASFRYGKDKAIKTSYVDKFLVSTKSKMGSVSNRDIHVLLQALLEKSDRDYLCGYDLNRLNINAKTYIYFVCSENIETPRKVLKKKVVKKTVIKKDIYYDNIEDIVIYPKALKSKNFVGMNTSYVIEKTKLDNAVKLFKKELSSNPSQKLYIISTGEEAEAISNADFIYRYFKKSRVPRGNILKKVKPLQEVGTDEDSLFRKTKIRFKLL